MLFTDHKVCLKQNKELVEEEIKKIKEIQGITILSVGIGSHIDIRELKKINSDERKVMRFGEYTNKEIVGESISHGMLLFGSKPKVDRYYVVKAEKRKFFSIKRLSQ